MAVIVVAGALLWSGALTAKPRSQGAIATATTRPRPTATATPRIPPGFKLYISSDGTFRIVYPKDWTARGTPPSAKSGITLQGNTGESAEVGNSGDIGTSPDSAENSLCLSINPNPGPAKTVMIGGQEWTQKTCGNPVFQAFAAAITYKGDLYFIFCASYAFNYDDNRKMYFTIMEQDFFFLK